MKTISWILPAAALAATGGCMITEPTESRTFNHSGFDSINASGGVNLVLKQGPYAISAEGPKSKLDKIVIEQQGSVLSIRREPSMNLFGIQGRDVVTVTAPGYTRIEATGGVDIETAGLTATSLTIKTSGGADIDATGFSADTLTVDNSGGADINISGTCKTLVLETSGGADFNAENLSCEAATVTASSGADVDVRVSTSAAGKASSGADINFIGNPATFTKDASSGGDIELVAP